MENQQFDLGLIGPGVMRYPSGALMASLSYYVDDPSGTILHKEGMKVKL